MNFVKFKGSEEIYLIGIQTLAEGLVRLNSPLPNTDLTVGFEILTNNKNGKVFGNYLDFTTVYRQLEDGSIILSNDGKVYMPPIYEINFELEKGTIIGEKTQTLENFEDLVVPSVLMDENYEFIEWIPEIPTDGKVEQDITFYAKTKYIPTLAELKAIKKAEIAAACNAIISEGVYVTLPDGSVEHFSLEENAEKHDQINLFGKQAQLAAGATQLEYHQDGHPCRWYSAEEMLLIITVAMQHVSYHTTYCNSLNMWIAGAETAEELNSIYYGADIPEKYQSEVLKDYLAAIMAEAEEEINAEKTTD